MKPFYCIDLTHDKKNTKINGEEFITVKVDEKDCETYSKKGNEYYGKMLKADPLWVNIVKPLSLIFGLYIMGMLLLACFKKGFAETFASLWGLFIAGVALLAIGGALHFIMKKRKEMIYKDKSEEELEKEAKAEYLALLGTMGVPSYAEPIDIFHFEYKLKDGDELPMAKENCFLNTEFHAYEEGGCLKMTDGDAVYSFDIKDMKRIRTVERKISIFFWNKDVKPTDPRFDPFLLEVDKDEHVTIYKMHILELEREGETFGIYFPDYELPAFERLTGLTAER
jgi:hypothetical protein